MKTLSRMLMCMACMALLASCEKDPEFLTGSEKPDAFKNFDASFIVYDLSEVNGPVGKDGCLKIWNGTGESSTLGQFSVEMNLLCNMDNMSFCNLIGSFIADDGSILFFSIAEGEYHVNEGEGCEVFQYSFNDLAKIEGGTGRFAGASGSFYPNAMIHNGELPSWFAKFNCKGDIKLKPNNQSEVDPLITEPLP